jgi:hypothetical protein
LDAFKVFAKADPAAYTEESIAASKSQQNGHATNGAAANGHDTTGLNGHPTNGLNGHATNTNGLETNGHDTDGHATNGHKNNRYAVNGHSENGNSNGHSNGSSNGTVKELAKTSKIKGGKVHCHCKALALVVVVSEDTALFCSIPRQTSLLGYMSTFKGMFAL